MADEKSHPDAFRHLAPRERILDALLDLSVSQGYESLSEEKIVERAGATRADFDANFGDLEDCAMQLVDAFLPELLEPVEAAYRAEERWPDSLRAASYVGANWIITHSREAHFGAVEMLKVGELARARRDSVFMSFAYMINAGRELSEDPASAPDLVGERAIGSMAELLTKELRQGIPDAHSFVPQLMYLAVLPYLGEQVALKELSIPPPSIDRADEGAERGSPPPSSDPHEGLN